MSPQRRSAIIRVEPDPINIDEFPVKGPTIPPDADWGPAFAPTMIVRRRTGPDPDEEITVTWPPDWPRPSAGNLIRVNGESLRVLEVTYDLDRSSLVLDCQ